MKLVRATPIPVVELSRRNLEVLWAKLDDPESRKTIVLVKDGQEVCAVRAVENDEHYADREAGRMLVKGEWI